MRHRYMGCGTSALGREDGELGQNGYEVIRGKRLQECKLAAAAHFGTDIDVGTKTVLATAAGPLSNQSFPVSMHICG